MKHKIDVNNFNFYYGDFQALIDLDIPIAENQITALIDTIKEKEANREIERHMKTYKR